MWREVVGDTEPWRRGRIFLVVLAVCALATRILGVGSSVLLGQIETERLIKEEGWERLSWFMADRSMRTGEVRNIRRARGDLQFWCRFPVTLVPHGRMTTYAESDQGPLQLNLLVGGTGGDWLIDSIWWRYIDPAALPPD